MAVPTPEELEAKFQKIAEEDENIKQFILTNKGKNQEVEVFGLKLVLPSVIPKSVRHELAKIQRKGDVDLEEAERDTYYLLSLLCLNEPFTTKEAWEYMDDQTGLAIDILGEVLEKGYQSEKKVQSFRGK